MKLIRNVGGDRVIDELRSTLGDNSSLDCASSQFSLFAFLESKDLLEKLSAARLILPANEKRTLTLLGGEGDRAYRNRLLSRWLATKCSEWIKKIAQIREAPATLPQCVLALAGDATVVFRDSAFADDVAKTNLTSILEQNGLQNVRSL